MEGEDIEGGGGALERQRHLDILAGRISGACHMGEICIESIMVLFAIVQR